MNCIFRENCSFYMMLQVDEEEQCSGTLEDYQKCKVIPLVPLTDEEDGEW